MQMTFQVARQRGLSHSFSIPERFLFEFFLFFCFPAYHRVGL
jgi:hypothetical protein